MSDQAGIPQEMRDAADATARALAIAKAIQAKQYPHGGAPDNLLPALVLSASIARASVAMCAELEHVSESIDDVANNTESAEVQLYNRIEGVSDAIDRIREPLLLKRLEGIETELYRLANIASDAQMSGAFSPCKKGRGDGGK